MGSGASLQILRIRPLPIDVASAKLTMDTPRLTALHITYVQGTDIGGRWGGSDGEY
jgi:hypothetical protein